VIKGVLVVIIEEFDFILVLWVWEVFGGENF